MHFVAFLLSRATPADTISSLIDNNLEIAMHVTKRLAFFDQHLK